MFVFRYQHQNVDSLALSLFPGTDLTCSARTESEKQTLTNSSRINSVCGNMVGDHDTIAWYPGSPGLDQTAREAYIHLSDWMIG